MIGTSLGPYKIIEPLGAGGMGEVYLAEDTRLGRSVAIKVLPAEFASDPERLARFEQEARAAAALNHPHIAVVHDIGTEGDTHFMVQEYLEGQSLRERLEQGALPLATVLDLGVEIGEALVAAHKAGIVHRDLKPDNIFVTEEGHAKVLDFGLAKLTEASAPTGAASMSPTMLGTVAGQIMGTAGYMAPEQVAGDADVDHRADIFAFGLLIYEATAGRQAFAGRSVMQTLDLILNEEAAPLTSIDASLPAELQRIVRKTMSKDPGRRYQSAAEMTIDIRQLQDDIAAGGAGGAAAVSPAAVPEPAAAFPWKLAGPAIIALLAVGYLLGSAVSGSNSSSGQARALEPTRFAVSVVGGHEMSQGFYPQLALSPSGRMLVFAADGLLWSRALDEEDARPLGGTEGAMQPFFSPGGDWIAFGQDDRLMRYRIADGSVSQLVDPIVGEITGGSWDEEGSITIGMLDRGLLRIPVGGSALETLAAPVAEEGETAYGWPQSLDGGRAVLYTALGPSFVAKDAEIVLLDVATGRRTVIAERGTHGRYVASGHVVYADSAGTLMAVPFDLARREVSPIAAEPVETGIRIAFWAGGASFAVSANGTLAFARGSNWENHLIAVVDREGSTLKKLGAPLTTDTVTLSRDGSTVAVDEFRPDNADIYTYNVETGGRVRLTQDDAMEENGIASPDGSRVAYMRSSAGSVGQILVQATQPGAQPRVVYEGAQYELPYSWSPDGKYLMIVASDAGGLQDVLAIEVDNPGEPLEIAMSDRREYPGDFSSDGRYFAYEADDDVIVTPFPSVDQDFVVADAKRPRWAGDELFFVRGASLMAMPIATEPSFAILGEPERLFDLPRLLNSSDPAGRATSIWPFPDGQRFLIDIPNPDSTSRATRSGSCSTGSRS